MRQIKFRAWSRSNEKYIKYTIGPSIVPDGIGGWTIKAKDLVFETFTGLKDENGKEIYEGDILFIGEPMNEYMQVEFKDGYFGWGGEHDGMYSFDPFGFEKFEVRGNIHDNPELLNS